MMFDEIERKSICRVNYDNEGKKWLLRIGDIENSVIEEFIFREDLPRVFDNRPRLFCKDGPEDEGTIGIWDWTAVPRDTDNEKDYVTAVYSVNEQPIEVFEIGSVSNESELISILREGITYSPCCEKVIFCFPTRNRYYSGFLCDRKKLYFDDNRCFLSEDVILLPLCDFAESDIFRFQSKQFIKNINKRFSYKNRVVKSPHEIVKEAILQRASWSVMKGRGISRKEWQQFREFIGEVTDDSLLTDIAASCECTIDEAREYVKSFIKISEERINREDIDIQILGEVVENNADLKARCEQLVADKWEEEHQLVVDEKRRELSEIEASMARGQEETNRLQNEILKLEQRKQVIVAEIENQEKISAEVGVKIKKKIEEAQNDVAEFISNISIYTGPARNVSIPNGNSACSLYEDGSDLYDGECDSWKEILESVEDELAEAGIANTYRFSFGAFLYSAYKNQASLLLAGPNGESIANAFSIGAFGKTAGVLECFGAYNKEAIDHMLQSEDEVVIIKNPFACEWINHICDLFLPQTKFYFLLTPFAEDLMIEPSSLYNYFMPVLTEGIIQKAPRNEFVGKKRSDKFVDYQKEEPKTIQEGIANSLNMGMLIKDRFQRVLTDMHVLDINASVVEDFMYSIYPYAYVTNKGTAIKEKIASEKQIDKDMRNYIMVQLGIEE